MIPPLHQAAINLFHHYGQTYAHLVIATPDAGDPDTITRIDVDGVAVMVMGDTITVYGNHIHQYPLRNWAEWVIAMNIIGAMVIIAPGTI